MQVTRLELTDFRSYPTAALGLQPGPSLFLGANGQGKTNLLEAVDYLATLSSHRVASDRPLVRTGAESACVGAEVLRDGRRLRLDVQINLTGRNRARVNDAPLPRPRDACGLVRTVLFAPSDLALVQGEPTGRRRFLDDLLVVRAPRYAAVRADYDRILRQRNVLLRSAGAARRGFDEAVLASWDDQLARVGGELLAGRLELVDALRPLVGKDYDAVAPQGGEVVLEYEVTGPVDRTATTSEQLTGGLRSALAAVRSRELERGTTLVGPHRDELAVGLGGNPARGYASHGESWSLALALRLAAYDLLRAEGEEPVLLLDDVFAELDGFRRGRLAGRVQSAEQLLVTAAVGDDVPGTLGAARFEVAAGRVDRVG